jgi:hypothetical protein
MYINKNGTDRFFSVGGLLVLLEGSAARTCDVVAEGVAGPAHLSEVIKSIRV